MKRRDTNNYEMHIQPTKKKEEKKTKSFNEPPFA